jgi:SNF family Na+-dependent transporter
MDFTFQAGPHLVCLFEDYSMSIGAPVVAIAECVAISWIYGSQQWNKDLAGFTGSERTFLTAVVWKYITPLSLTVRINCMK